MLENIKCLGVNDEATILNNPVDIGKSVVGLSRKKSHEIALLAPIINEICQKNGCDVLVDVGSGVVSMKFFFVQLHIKEVNQVNCH